MLGAALAHHLGCRWRQAGTPMCTSTRRAARTGFCACCPSSTRFPAEQKIEDLALAAAVKFYSIAQVLFAPNLELCRTCCKRSTGRPCLPDAARRGCRALRSTEAQSRAGRSRPVCWASWAACPSRRTWPCCRRCSRNWSRWAIREFPIPHRRPRRRRGMAARTTAVEETFPGVLRGEELAAAYANMDLFVFPSHTDTFGNVVLEALASGVPAIVTPDGGPCTIVRDGDTGRIVKRRRLRRGDRWCAWRPREARRHAPGRARLRAHGKLGRGVRGRLRGIRHDSGFSALLEPVQKPALRRLGFSPYVKRGILVSGFSR